MTKNSLTREQSLKNTQLRVAAERLCQISALSESPLVWQKLMSLYGISAVKGRFRWRHRLNFQVVGLTQNV